jgi:sulfur-oxidizing protein SoxX
VNEALPPPWERAGVRVAIVALAALSACSSTLAKEEAAPRRGDPMRGREVFVSREGGFCVLCHAAPGVDIAGDIGPSLAGVGTRLTPAELRVRVADMSRVKADTAMPSFHRTEGLNRVDPARRGKPVLDDRQLDDVVAYLASLK